MDNRDTVTLDNKPREYPCTEPGCTKVFARNYLRLNHFKRHQNWKSLNPVNDLSLDPADHPLKQVPKQLWITSIERLMQGHTSRHGKSTLPAVIAPNGCHLPRIVPEKSGYINIKPVVVVFGRARKDEPKKKAPVTQKAHRVACYLTKFEDDVYNLLYRGYEASHLCHQPGCINPDHLVVEAGKANQSRKICSAKVDVKMSVDGLDYILKAEGCPHSPRCIIRLESRAAIELLTDG